MNLKIKYIAAVLLSSFLFYSCKKEIIKSVPTTDSTSIKTEALKTDSTVLNPTDSLYTLVDKSVIGTQFLTKSSLAVRLKKLLGADYEEMVKNWNTETPFEKQENILHAWGCKQHDCNSFSYDLFIDVKNNKINVYKFAESKLTVFKEDNFDIEIKDGFLKDLNIKKENVKN
ncbi:CRISPR/Cas system-associated protein Csx1 [Flavobacterium nitrogenifigens]|uniref:CRISPR/Cas system-associated protein Csx1 n=2 Tax=Flavobacterium TaxID=237 RepID=A0A7W7N787_9FLAO|nr:MULTISPECIES: hypothetical protein [Flavobacterium]MBB4802488.1 CRISPR/Cas system-associated protein Csx1 [Flavobacterium nitrogenifigens]MBB6387446.1 CRISPR/Cas system-associated protein Csx1 [Flavobacterium notoginsengisoli]